MSRNYDNWERLVAAVIKRRQIWELCHQPSRTPSVCSEATSSDFSSNNDVELENNIDSAQNPIPEFVFTQDSLISRGRVDRGRLWSSYVDLENKEEECEQKPIPKFVFTQGSLISRGRVGKGRLGPSFLIQLRRGIRISDQDYLGDGSEFVVKKLLSEVIVTEEEFERVFGNCRHENVAVPRAYFFSDEAIYGNYIFNEYHRQGSLYDMLHGTSGCRLDWESRLKIAIGAARGIAHIHGQNGGNIALGNVKSSNIFLNSRQYGCVSDFGLAAILKSPGEQVADIYRAAEYEYEYKIENPSHESDVCSFGVVLLELLTGKSPMEPQAGFPKDVHIVEWALSIIPEDWSSRLFDQSLWSSALSDRRKREIIFDELYMLKFSRRLELEEEIKAGMVKMLQLARRCLVMLPEDRPKMFELVLLLENIPSLGNIIPMSWFGKS